MKKKFGFTLAEVLITLGIIGVVAALTTPALVKNSGQAKIGPSLAKFVNTFETGMQTMMTDQGIPVIEDPGIVMPLLLRSVVMSQYESKYTYTDATGKNNVSIEYVSSTVLDDINNCILNGKNCDGLDYDGDGNVGNSDYLDRLGHNLTTIWQLKDGSLMIFYPIQLPDNYDPLSVNGTYKGVIGEVIVDIDGNKGSNKVGKDVFGFLLDASGILIPYGSNAHKYAGSDGTRYLRNYDRNTDICALDENLKHNFACTGKIADNNWKAEY